MIIIYRCISNSAQHAFDLLRSHHGKSTHRLVSGPAKGMDRLCRSAPTRVRFSAPVIERLCVGRGLGNRAMRFMGTDPFTESAFALAFMVSKISPSWVAFDSTTVS